MTEFKTSNLYEFIKTKKYYLFIGLSIVWMVLIYINSAFEGGASARLSDTLIQVFLSVFGWLGKGPGIASLQDLIKSEGFHLFIRKTAHFIEFGILGLLIFSALGVFHNIRNKTCNRFVMALIICTVYAVSDEIHQLFVEGRVFLFTDILIDFVGSLAFIGVMLLIIKNKKAIHGS